MNAKDMGRKRMASMTAKERSELGKLAVSMRWSPKTKQDKRIGDRLRHKLALTICGAVDSLFDWLKHEGRPRALVIHQETAWVADPNSKDFRIQQQKYPDTIIGIYDRAATRDQVFDDIKQIPALVSVLR